MEATWRNDLRKQHIHKLWCNIVDRWHWLTHAVADVKYLRYTYSVPEDLPTPAAVRLTDDTVILRYPYNKFLITEIEKVMASHPEFEEVYRQKESNITNAYEDPYITWRLKGEGFSNFGVTARFCDDLPNSECKRKKVGEEMKLMPVYSWECGDDDESV